MKLIFAGTPEFARCALDALVAAGHEVALVLTQPDRPAGRGMKLQASAVKQAALASGIAVLQPRSLRLDGRFPEDAAAAQAAIAAVQAEAMIVAAYGLLLPQWVLDAPRRGCLNLHASVLPRWRGAAPIHRAIEAGDTHTGITLMQMDAGLDTGAVLCVAPCAIEARDTTASLHDRLAALGARLIVQALAQPQTLQPTAQPGEGVTYAHKIEKQEGSIDWTQSAEVIDRRVRAFNPFPVASTTAQGETIKLWCSEIESCSRLPDKACGQILGMNDAGISVACGQGVLRLTQLQRAGGKRLPVAEFLRGFALQAGQILGAP